MSEDDTLRAGAWLALLPHGWAQPTPDPRHQGDGTDTPARELKRVDHTRLKRGRHALTKDGFVTDVLGRQHAGYLSEYVTCVDAPCGTRGRSRHDLKQFSNSVFQTVYLYWRLRHTVSPLRRRSFWHRSPLGSCSPGRFIGRCSKPVRAQ